MKIVAADAHDLRGVAADDPMDPEPWLRISQLQQQLGSLPKAREAANKANALDPENVEVAFNNVSLLQSEGKPKEAIDGLKKLKPAPLGDASEAALIQQANYEEHLELLRGCDLVIEAIAERMDWKLDLYNRIAPALASHTIVASNTSGLSITQLSETLPESVRARFCGIHFFVQ